MKDDDDDPEGVRPVLREVRPGVRDRRGSRSKRSHPQNEPNYAQDLSVVPVDGGAVHQVHRPVPGSGLRQARTSPPRSCSARCRTATRGRARSSAPCWATRPRRASSRARHAVGHDGTSAGWGRSAACRSGRPSTSAATTPGTRRRATRARRQTIRPTASRAGTSSASGSTRA